ncbi:3672_t:CDS:2, partial [Funneliformis geosporum]
SAWEVKLKYPDKLHPTHTKYPLCPERRIVKRQELGPHQNNDLIDKLIWPIGEERRLRKMLADPALVDRKIFYG